MKMLLKIVGALVGLVVVPALGGQECPLMPYSHCGAMAADDMHAILAIYAYLHRLTPVVNRVTRLTDAR